MNWSRMSIFKMPSRYRSYNFKPRYYDERKEALKHKLAREEKINSTVSEREIKFQAQLEETWGNTERKSQILKSNIRLLVILLIILTSAYYVFIGMDTAEEAINNAITR